MRVRSCLITSSGRNDANSPPDLPSRPFLPYTPGMNITAPYIQPILEAIQIAGGRPLIVGGAVRDALIGVELNEFDIEV
ncbi:MAG: hypothetical protein ABIV47_06260, partial [Roseiflexaceae bacterium]